MSTDDKLKEGRVPELEPTRANAEYWINAAKGEKDKVQALICLHQAINAWKNAAYAMADKHPSSNERNEYREFWERHALGSKLCPSCMLCGHQRPRGEWAITHMELPDIYICRPCVDAARSAQSANGALELLKRIQTDLNVRAALMEEDAVALSSGIWRDLCDYIDDASKHHSANDAPIAWTNWKQLRRTDGEPILAWPVRVLPTDIPLYALLPASGDGERWQAGLRFGFPEFCSHWEGAPNDTGVGWYHQLTGDQHFQTAEEAIDAAIATTAQPRTSDSRRNDG